MNEITIGEKVYISAKRAAEITGYARDYVGQLCREGHVDAKMVGRSWYVYEPAIRAHRFGPEVVEEVPAAKGETAEEPESGDQGDATWHKPVYTPESPELLPEMMSPKLEELLPPAEETLTDMQAAWREWFEQRQTELKTPEIESSEVSDERNEAHEAAQEPEEPVAEVDDNTDDEEVVIPLHHLEDDEEEAVEVLAEENRVPIRPIEPAPTHMGASTTRPPRLDIERPMQIIAPQLVPVRPIVPDMKRQNVEGMPAEAEHGRIVTERIISSRGSRRSSAIAAKPAVGSGSYAPIIAILIGVSLVSLAVAAIGTGYAGRYLTTLPAKSNPVINFLIGTREFNRQ